MTFSFLLLRVTLNPGHHYTITQCFFTSDEKSFKSRNVLEDHHQPRSSSQHPIIDVLHRGNGRFSSLSVQVTKPWGDCVIVSRVQGACRRRDDPLLVATLRRNTFAVPPRPCPSCHAAAPANSARLFHASPCLCIRSRTVNQPQTQNYQFWDYGTIPYHNCQIWSYGIPCCIARSRKCEAPARGLESQ